MMLRRFAVVAAAMSAAVACATAGCGAGAEHTVPIPAGPGWRSVPAGGVPCRGWRAGPAAELNSVAATGPRDAWAAGTCMAQDGKLAGVIQHWDGRAWQPVRTAPALIAYVAASSPNDVWAAGTGGSITTVSMTPLHWDGSHWSLARQGMPVGDNFLALAASSTAGAWGLIGLPIGGPGFLAHWDGHRWQRVPVPRQVMAESAEGPKSDLALGTGGDIWVGGDTGVRPGVPPADINRPANLPQPYVARYHDGQWTTYPVPLAPGTHGGSVTAVAVARGTLWAFSGDYASLIGIDHVYTADELSNGRWTTSAAPGNGAVSAATADDRGNLYVLGGVPGGSGAGVFRWDGLRWSQQYLPLPHRVYVDRSGSAGQECSGFNSHEANSSGYRGLVPSALAAVPGTGTVWAAGLAGDPGFLDVSGCPDPKAQPVTEVAGPAPR